MTTKNKLKTLQDFEKEQFWDIAEAVYTIRQEAIKIMISKKTKMGSMYVYPITIQDWMEFFNLTEEDLK